MNKIAICILLSCMMVVAVHGQSSNSIDHISLHEKASYDYVHELLDGRIAGVRVGRSDGNPNNAPVITVRGINGLRGDLSPLFIVDGAVIGNVQNYFTDAFHQYGEQTYTSSLNPLSFLNIYDIESIEVLKDHAATALYGSRGANGVVIITTRRAEDRNFHLDWNSDVAVTPSVSHTHSINVGSMTKGLALDVSAYIRDMRGSIPNLSSLYGGGRINLESKVGESVRFGFNSIFVLGNLSNPSATAYYGQGSQTLALRSDALSATTYDGWVSDYDDDLKDTRVVNSAYLTINFSPFVKWTTRAGADYSKNIRLQWYGNSTQFGKVNNGAASEQGSTTFSYNASTAFDYDQYIDSKHLVKASLGAEIIGDQSSFNTMDGINFYMHELRGNALSLMQCEKKIHRFDYNYSTLSSYASVGYGYDGMVGMDAGLRSEWLPGYGSAPVFYPYAGLYADIHKAFMADVRTVSSLRLEGGYGVSGKQIYMPYEMTGRLLAGDYPSVPSGAEPYFEGLDRVLSEGWHAGLRAGFLNERILFEASVYSNRIKDNYSMFSFGQVNSEGLWKMADRALQYSRDGVFANWGVEAGIEADVFRRKDFTWRINANLAYEDNRVTAVHDQDMFGSTIGNGISGNVNVKGYPVSAICGYREDGEGNIIDINRDTRINQADKVILGNPLPKVYGSYGMSFLFYGITLDFLADGAIGHEIVNLHSLCMSGKTDITSSHVEKGDFLRLKRISAGYDIPIKASWIRGLNVNVSANNLFTLTSYSGYSPDVNSYGPSQILGFDYGSLPVFKTVVLGICAKF